MVGRAALTPLHPRAVLRLPVPQTGFPLPASSTTPAPTGQTLGEKLPTSGLERGSACHPLRSGSLRQAHQILRRAQDDKPSLHMSDLWWRPLHMAQK